MLLTYDQRIELGPRPSRFCRSYPAALADCL